MSINYLNNILDLTSRIDLSKSEYELTDTVINEFRSSGVDLITYCSLLPTQIIKEGGVFINNWPDEINKKYIDENLLRSDFILTECIDYMKPVIFDNRYWDSVFNNSHKMTKKQKIVLDYWQYYECAGVGFSVPFFGPLGDVGVFSVERKCSNKNSDNDLIFDTFLMTNAIGSAVHKKMFELKGINIDFSKRVTPRERECLKWASEGKTAWEIGRILSLSDRTVVNYLRNAYRKLGATNKAQAVAKAILYGLI